MARSGVPARRAGDPVPFRLALRVTWSQFFIVFRSISTHPVGVAHEGGEVGADGRHLETRGIVALEERDPEEEERVPPFLAGYSTKVQDTTQCGIRGEGEGEGGQTSPQRPPSNRQHDRSRAAR